jgi:hypothetical protein
MLDDEELVQLVIESVHAGPVAYSVIAIATATWTAMREPMKLRHEPTSG